MSEKKSTTRSHYLPKTYLKHFLQENSLVMYKKGKKFFREGVTPDQRIHYVLSEEALINIGVENDLYNPGIEKVSSDDLEDIFQECGESIYNDLVNDIEALPEDSFIPDNIKRGLCLFMATMRVRTPQFKSEMNDIAEGLYKFMAEMHFDNLTDIDVQNACKNDLGREVSLDFAKKLKEMAKDKSYEVKFPNAHFLKQAMLLLNVNAEIFYNMKMTIVKSRRLFITSDNPVVYFVPEGKTNFYNHAKSLKSSFTELFFPITKNIGLTLNRRSEDERIKMVGREIVDIFNYNISHNSFDFIFSPIKMNSLELFVNEFMPYPFKFMIN